MKGQVYNAILQPPNQGHHRGPRRAGRAHTMANGRPAARATIERDGKTLKLFKFLPNDAAPASTATTAPAAPAAKPKKAKK